jgi:hypothetical protein
MPTHVRSAVAHLSMRRPSSATPPSLMPSSVRCILHPLVLSGFSDRFRCCWPRCWCGQGCTGRNGFHALPLRQARTVLFPPASFLRPFVSFLFNSFCLASFCFVLLRSVPFLFASFHFVFIIVLIFFLVIFFKLLLLLFFIMIFTVSICVYLVRIFASS